MKDKMSANILAHNLKYESRVGDEHSSVFIPKGVLILSTSPQMHCHDLFVLSLLGKGHRLIKSNGSFKSILEGVQYFIVKPASSKGITVERYFMGSLEDINRLLSEGWSICRETPLLGYVDILTPSDQGKLEERFDLNAKWREVVCAVINCEIEANCNWSTSGVFLRDLSSSIADVNIDVPDDCKFISPGTVITASEYVCAYILRWLEPHINAVFDFIIEDRDVLYLAEPSVTGVQVNRFVDVRAILWHSHTEKEQLKREQAIEDGLAAD